MTGWQTVYGYLLARTFTGCDEVFDGPPKTGTPPKNFVVVGADAEQPTGAGSYTQDYDNEALISESGEVLCWFVAQSGDTDFSTLRDRVNGWVAELSTALRDKTLGGLLRQGSEVNVGRVEPGQRRSGSGAVVDAVVAVSYFTRL